MMIGDTISNSRVVAPYVIFRHRRCHIKFFSAPQKYFFNFKIAFGMVILKFKKRISVYLQFQWSQLISVSLNSLPNLYLFSANRKEYFITRCPQFPEVFPNKIFLFRNMEDLEVTTHLIYFPAGWASFNEQATSTLKNFIDTVSWISAYIYVLQVDSVLPLMNAEKTKRSARELKRPGTTN